MRKNLFVYGPWHGRLVEAENLGDQWRVPVPNKAVSFDGSKSLTTLFEPPQTVTYHRFQGMTMYYGLLRQFVCYTTEPKELNPADLLDAALLALGVTQA